MLISKLYPGQPIWVGKDIQITVLGNLQEFVRMGVQIRQLQNIKVGEKELWDKERPHETLSVITNRSETN